MSEFESVQRQLDRIDYAAGMNDNIAIKALTRELRAVLAQEAGPLVERQPVAYLVTDVYGQKKALRSGAEGIERHRNAGSSLVPLFASPPAPVALNARMADILQSLRENANPALFVPGQLAEVDACLDKVKELNQ